MSERASERRADDYAHQRGRERERTNNRLHSFLSQLIRLIHIDNRKSIRTITHSQAPCQKSSTAVNRKCALSLAIVFHPARRVASLGSYYPSKVKINSNSLLKTPPRRSRSLFRRLPRHLSRNPPRHRAAAAIIIITRGLPFDRVAR